MDIKALRPKVFAANPESSDAKKQWVHWFKSFTIYISKLEGVTEADKFNLLINHIDSAVYELISETETYDTAVELLKATFAKTPSPIFARYVLKSCKQQSGESLDIYLQNLKRLSLDCNFRAVTATVHKEEAIRDAFIGGLISKDIRQRLLENHELTLAEAYEKARSLELAQKNAESYNAGYSQQTVSLCNSAETPATSKETTKTSELSYDASSLCTAAVTEKCMFCGNKRHPRKMCPARMASCFKCSKKGHFAKVCRSKVDATLSEVMSIESASATSDRQHNDNAQTKVNIPITIDGVPVNALVDTGSTLSHISEELSRHLDLRLEETICNVGLAVRGCSSKSLGLCKANIEVNGDAYSSVPFTVLKDLVSDVILGRDFMDLHQSVNIHFGEEKPTLHLGELRIVKTPTPVSLFKHLSDDCRPIATKSRHYSNADQSFISSEIQRLLKENLIERSSSPWRAQPLVVTQENHKKRIVID